jgi:hypothetical protein
MFRALTSLLLCTVCWLGPDQAPRQFTEVDFRVKGVGLGSAFRVVLRQLGQPVSSKRQKMDDDFVGECGPAYTSLRLRYEGASLELSGDLKGRNFFVISMEVTSPKFLIAPGVKIGMTEEETRSKLGAPVEERTESGSRILIYATKGNDGSAGLYFRDARLVKVLWEYIAC